MSSLSSRASFNRHPLAWIAALFACGVAASSRMSGGAFAFAAAALTATLLAVFCAWRAWRGATLILFAASFLTGAAALKFENSSIAAHRVRALIDSGRIASGDPVEATGAIERAPEIAPDGLYFTLDVESLNYKNEERKAAGAIEYFAPVYDERTRAAYDALQLVRGARVRVMARVRREEGFRNPGVKSLKEILDSRGVDASAGVKSPLLIERLPDAPHSILFAPLVALDEWRAFLLARIAALFDRETAGVLQAVLLKNRRALARDTSERFRAGGTFHLLVISGLHIGFIGGVFFWLTRRLTRKRVWQFLAPTFFLWTYALAVGLDEPIARAALMFTFVALAPIVGRRGSPTNAVGAAALLLLALHPTELFNAAFQLTVSSVLSITLIAAPLLNALHDVGAWRLSRATPYPPRVNKRWRTFCETLFWSERAWRAETERYVFDYRLFKTPLAAKLERWRAQKILRYAFAAIVVSASVQIGLLPLLVVHFHRVSFASLLLNTFEGALMACACFAALVALAASFISTSLAAPFVWLTARLVWLVAHGVDPFAWLGVAQMRPARYAGELAFLYALYFLPLAALCLALARWRPLALRAAETFLHDKRFLAASVFASVLIFVLILTHPFSAPRPDGRLHVDFLDVGQGDSALVTMPDGATLLVDAGGRRQISNEMRAPIGRSGATRGSDNITEAYENIADAADRADSSEQAHSDADDEERAPFERDGRSVGEAVVSEFLWNRGLSGVDYILATHAHADHMDGLNDVARNFRVRAAFIARAPMNDATFKKFAAMLKAERIPVQFLARGDALHFGALTIDVLAPPRGDANAPSGNDESLVLRIRYGERAILLTGDAERGEESLMLSDAAASEAQDNEGDASALHCDVVKVGHHGSRTSSTSAFVAATRPQFAIISVGLHSVFNHPHKEIVERWRAAGARVLTTGESGTISVDTDGEDLRLKTYAESLLKRD